MFNLLSFITTVSLTATTHCMTDGLALVCLAINAVVRHLLLVVQAGTSD